MRSIGKITESERLQRWQILRHIRHQVFTSTMHLMIGKKKKLIQRFTKLASTVEIKK